MYLINADQGDICIGRKAKKGLRKEPFRCHIYNFIFSFPGKIKCLKVLSLCQRAVEVSSIYARLIQCSYLILHQTDERRDHQRNSLKHQRRHLITDRLACPCRHDSKYIPAFQKPVNQRLLTIAKGIVSKVVPQNLIFILSVHDIPVFIFYFFRLLCAAWLSVSAVHCP